MGWIQNQKGFALVTTYFLFAAITIGASATFTRSYVYMREAEKQKNAIVALEMSEAAVDQAIVQLAANSAYAGTGYTDFSSGSARGGYSITVSTPAGASEDVRQISVTGFSPSNSPTDQGYRTSTVNVYTQFIDRNFFTKAIFADASYLNVGNGTTDSYDSRNGVYNPATAGSQGDVGTNSTAAGAVSLTGNAVVNGDVTVGPGGDPTSVISSTGTITGDQIAADESTELPTPSTLIASSGAMSVGGNNTLSLSSGIYHYSSLSISGNGKLTTTGEVTIYVSGTVDIAGNGTAAHDSLPQNLKIYVTNDSSVSVSGNGNTYAAIYAPHSDISISGNGTVYGAVVGKTVSMHGEADFHYDKALADVSGSVTNDPEILSWVQSGNSSWTI